MKFLKTIFVLSFLILVLFLVFPKNIFGQACTDQSDLNAKINCYQEEISKLGVQSKTLSNQIAQYNAQINLTSLKIAQVEDKITLLGGRIDQLEVSLEALTKAYEERTKESYKMVRVGDSLLLLLSSSNLTEAFSRFHYLQKIQQADESLLQRLQKAQTDYKEQKTEQETLQEELNKQKANLNLQKQAKNQLLTETKNDEKRYQQLLGEAIAQLNIGKGLGTESFMRNVSEGERIGNIISTASGCSSGRHLHFEVHKGNDLQDPNNYLRGISFTYSYTSDQYGYYGTVNPHGSWNWPMNEPIMINQGFGATGFARDFGYANNVHPGIDLESPDSQVKSVKEGKLYRGSIQCGGRYPGVLPYAKVENSDGTVVYYEHMIVE